MATQLLDKQQLATLLCQQVYHGGNPTGSLDCPRGDRDQELENAAKLVRIYGDTPRYEAEKDDAKAAT